uniref:Uncharacterized protein n=1 Tax=Anguilla anguilla TaxID=7936 RepID=A0A0E9RFR0_ANGAN
MIIIIIFLINTNVSKLHIKSEKENDGRFSSGPTAVAAVNECC